MAAEDEITGVRGLCTYGNFIYALYDVGWTSTRLCIFNGTDDLAVLYDGPLPEVVDPHSLWVGEGHMLVTSTGTDELLAYELRDEFPLGSPRIVWRASSAKADTHHLNSVAVHEGHVLVSAFGLRSGELWRTAERGYIYDVTASQVVITDLHHPHSLKAALNDVFYIESSRQVLRSFKGTRINLSGYLRGCGLLDETTMLVGTNVARTTSKSTGIVHNDRWWYADEGELPVGECTLALVNLQNSSVDRYYDLSPFGREVYDVCASLKSTT